MRRFISPCFSRILLFSLTAVLLACERREPGANTFLSQGVSTNYERYLPLLNLLTDQMHNTKFVMSRGDNPFIRLLSYSGKDIVVEWKGKLDRLEQSPQTQTTRRVKYWYTICTNWNVRGFGPEDIYSDDNIIASYGIWLDVDIIMIFVIGEAPREAPSIRDDYNRWALSKTDTRGDICVKLAHDVYIVTRDW